MMNTTKLCSRVLGAAGLAALLGACVQLPTESRGAVDQRPLIAFKVDARIAAPAARVFVNGTDAGSLTQYRDGAAMLPVLPGTHTIEVRDGATVLLAERVFVTDGARRVLLITGASAP